MRKGAIVIGLAVLGAVGGSAGTGAAAPRTLDCDYARAPYSVRDLPYRGGYFSPDSRELVFPVGGELKVYDIAGRKTERSIKPPPDGGPPVTQVLQWTPRGLFVTRGAAASGRPTPDEDPNRTAFGQVWLVQPDGRGWRHVEVGLPKDTEVVEYGLPRVSPDGRRVNYTFVDDVGNQAQGKPLNGWRVAVADVVYAAGGSVRFAKPRFLTDDSYYNETKDWSGDSNQIVLASTRGSTGDRRALNSDAFALDARSGKFTRITTAPSWEEAHDLLRGDFGPGEADTFISDRDTPNQNSPYYENAGAVPNDFDSVLVAASIPALAVWTSHELFVAGPRGDQGWRRRLTFDYAFGTGWVARFPLWSPNGRYIRFGQWRSNGATALGQRERLITFACRGATVKRARRCLNSRGGARGRRLGPALLGRTRARQRRAFKGKRLRSRGGIDRYCVTGGGSFRIGYPTNRLNRTLGRSLRARIRKRAVFILTSSRRYSVKGIRPGSSTRALRRRLRGERRLRVGRNVWFLASGRRARLLYKARGRRVLEVGMGDRRLTRRRGAQGRFLRGWRGRR